MKYRNQKTGKSIELGKLTVQEKKFFERATGAFRSGLDWFAFESLVFGSSSPVFDGKRRRVEVKKDPLFQALKDMWLELGIAQGMVRREEKGVADAARRKKSRRRKAAHVADRQRVGDVAPST